MHEFRSLKEVTFVHLQKSSNLHHEWKTEQKGRKIHYKILVWPCRHRMCLKSLYLLDYKL